MIKNDIPPPFYDWLDKIINLYNYKIFMNETTLYFLKAKKNYNVIVSNIVSFVVLKLLITKKLYVVRK